MRKTKRAISQMLRALRRREERKRRREQVNVDFSVHQLLSAAKFEQNLIIMGK